jgi:hypothetical protein
LHLTYLIFNIDDSIVDQIFTDNSKDILAGFFEDRPEELAQSLVTNWQRYLDGRGEINSESCNKIDQIKLKSAKLLEKQHHKNRMLTLFNRWKISILTKKNQQLQSNLDDQKLKYEEYESTSIIDQIQLRELRDKVLSLENSLSKELDDKIRKSRAVDRRKKMKELRENSKSLSLSKAGKMPISRTHKEDPYMVEDEVLKIDTPNGYVNIKQGVRNTYGLDQRGSTCSAAVQRRQNLINSKAWHSVAPSAISVPSSNFSFHPEINRSSMWKPKYDDHHDHKQMWKRMHGENKKIQSKKRIMSQEKDRKELACWTFTPRLVTDKHQEFKITKHSLKDAESLSNRMYDYADKFKSNLKLKKSMIDHERGQQISFTPTILSSKASKKSMENARNKGNIQVDISSRKSQYMKITKNGSRLVSMAI